MSLCNIIAQATQPDTGRLFIWCGILIVVVIIGCGGIMLLRRRLKEAEDAATTDPGFSLSELRAMRDRGEITPDEYERTRAHVIAKVKSSFNKPAPPPGDASNGPGPTVGDAPPSDGSPKV